ncbi:permease prefix domain 1-containing protein [Stackebrandtia nassauensis]|uniref:Uncharacterized protein n=1 Tax=Stackebrandtia nassauensis (strain DSM 44728 / CIP 108903 / NRRL B-16338 / NBRC 102104 / LLR-40K-21) TaxID=446470 RepID=D3PY42_STANL|nr:permease prefix domain 1-containing protein [Stackebrandtia nassauensis]ADD45371.1 hypothetical protein Snas_5741 [Stackebrandtia nassauensis DSM 44728]
MTITLTDRYVHEVVRRIPADQRDDVAEELRTTIADTIDARESDNPAEAEREVLTEMGDPIRLAARYADRPLALIGPELYPPYIRLLTMLLTIVLPIAVLATVILEIVDNGDVGEVIAAGIGSILTVGGQMIAWLTVIFALIDRFVSREQLAKDAKPWSPDDLPVSPQTDRHSFGAVAAALWDMLVIALIVWQHFGQPYALDGGKRVEILNPALWTGWMWPILAGLAGIAITQFIRSTRPAWTIRLATWHTAAHAVFALPMVWVLHQREFFNPAFLSDLDQEWLSTDSFYTVAIAAVLIVSAIEVYKRYREATHAR